jgi:RNA polymerase sigma factor (sigma-70 family)
MDSTFRDLTPDELIGHTRWLRRFALRLVADESSADDLAQQAWVELAKQRPERRIVDLRAFLAGITRRLARKDRDGRARRRAREARAARPEALPDSAAMQAEIEAQRVVVEELGRLEPQLRDALMWRFYEGLDSAEIARRQGVPASTERARVARGLARLRERLDRRFGSADDSGPGARALWCTALMRVPLSTGASLTSSATLFGAGTMSLATKTLATAAAVAALALGTLFVLRERDARVAPQLQPEQHATRSQPAVAALDEPMAAVDERVALASPARAAAAPTRSLAVRVVDAATLAPAEAYALEVVRGDGETSLLWTDEEGRVTLPPQLAAGARTLRALDHPDLHRSEPEELELPVEGADTEVQFPVVLGPRYDLVLPPDAAAFAQELFADGSAAPKAYLVDGLKEDRTRWEFRLGTPVRPGDLPWVRFTPDQARWLSSGPWRLELRDVAGFWRFGAEVTTITERQREPVRLVGGRRSNLALRVVADGEPVTRLLSVALIERSTGATQFAQLQDSGPLGPGSDSFRHLPPGAYDIRVEEGGFEDYARAIELAPGEEYEVLVELEPVANAHDLVVQLRSESGTFDFRMVFAKATNAADPDDTRLALAAARGDARNPRFVLEGLTPGTWEVELTGPIDLPFDPAGAFEVDAAAGEVTVTCLDRSGPPLASTTLEVRDRETGELVPGGGVALYRDGAHIYSTGFVLGECELFPGAQVARGMDWLVSADGYRACWVEDDSYPFAGSVDGRRVVELERGWGTLVVAGRWQDGFEPIADQEVQADGVPVGRTDARGRLLLNLDAAPSTLHLPHATLRTSSDALDPETGRIVTGGRLPPLYVQLVE